MYNVRDHIQASLGHFRMEGYWFRYSSFVPRLYNWCKELGFEPGKIMPSRAFCSDESQGYPIILLAKHFGTFPFNHGGGRHHGLRPPRPTRAPRRGSGDRAFQPCRLRCANPDLRHLPPFPDRPR